MNKLLCTIFFTTLILFSCWWAWGNSSSIKGFIKEKLEAGDFLTLEERYTPRQIMAANQAEMLQNSKYKFLEPEQYYYPYLIMEVKYSINEQNTGESSMLWSLKDGEMVTDSSSWEKTHGFEDAITANADRNDFKIINAISKHNGFIDRTTLAAELHADGDTLDNWIDGVRRKKLVLRSGNGYRLHLSNPNMNVVPTTNINSWLVKRPYKGSQRIAKKYSCSQIEKICQAAFGENFAIRSTKEVFLPVYEIKVQNPDGSLMTSHWNALNGKRIKNQF